MEINQNLHCQNMNLHDLSDYFGIKLVSEWDPTRHSHHGYAPTQWAQIVGEKEILVKSPFEQRGLSFERLRKYSKESVEALLHEICHIITRPKDLGDIPLHKVYDRSEWELGLPPLQFALATFALLPELGEACRDMTEAAYIDDGGRMGVFWAQSTVRAFELGFIDMDGHLLLTKCLCDE